MKLLKDLLSVFNLFSGFILMKAEKKYSFCLLCYLFM